MVVKRETDSRTRAVSLVVSRGFGVTVKVTLWWVSACYHQRDAATERALLSAIDAIEDEQARREARPLV